jgi:zinc/manganese transport system substrate-binding protein
VAKFSDLKSWAKKELTVIPRSDRKLVTAHAAFGYFCKEYGFKSIPVLGLGRSDDATPQYLAESIEMIRSNKIRAVFPEDQANPKVLAEMTRSTGAKVGGALVADGTSPSAHTFEAMLRHNVGVIVAALKGD